MLVHTFKGLLPTFGDQALATHAGVSSCGWTSFRGKALANLEAREAAEVEKVVTKARHELNEQPI